MAAAAVLVQSEVQAWETTAARVVLVFRQVSPAHRLSVAAAAAAAQMPEERAEPQPEAEEPERSTSPQEPQEPPTPAAAEAAVAQVLLQPIQVLLAVRA